VDDPSRLATERFERYNVRMTDAITSTPIETEELKEFFIFELDEELYAVSIEEVDHIMKIPPVTSVPNAPRAIIGIFHLRGSVVVVLDLIRRMNLVREKPLTTGYLFVAHRGKNHFAIFIDKPKTIARIPLTALRDMDPFTAAHIPPQYAKGMFLYTFSSAPHRRKEPSILIEAHPASLASIESEGRQKPVVWLNLEKLLDQEDLLTLFA
jgi:purine-binding chemotaxis protein CheW